MIGVDPEGEVAKYWESPINKSDDYKNYNFLNANGVRLEFTPHRPYFKLRWTDQDSFFIVKGKFKLPKIYVVDNNHSQYEINIYNEVHDSVSIEL